MSFVFVNSFFLIINVVDSFLRQGCHSWKVKVNNLHKKSLGRKEGPVYYLSVRPRVG